MTGRPQFQRPALPGLLRIVRYALVKIGWRLLASGPYQRRWRWLAGFGRPWSDVPQDTEPSFRNSLRLVDDAYQQQKSGGDDVLYAWAQELESRLPENLRCDLLIAAFCAYRDAAHADYTRLGERLRSEPRVKFHRPDVALKIALLDYFNGRFAMASALLENHHRRWFPRSVLGLLDDFLTLADHGYRPGKRPRCKPLKGNGMRVAYVANYSLPYITNGYTTRTQGLVSAIRQSGVEIEVFTRFGFPADLTWRALPRVSDTIGHVRYRHGPSPLGGFRLLPPDQYIDRYATYLCKRLSRYRPSIIQTASNFINGLAAVEAGSALGIPVIYEVRGLWEVTRLSRHPHWQGTDEHRLMQKLETQAACRATRVLTLTGALADELVARGVAAEKIGLLPNAVDCVRFDPERAVPDARKSDTCVFGYIGSLVDYEGLDLLIEAAKCLVDSGEPDFAVLIVGGGDALQALRRRTSALGLADKIEFRPAVAHDAVPALYHELDVAVFPRHPLPVCEIVSPLKPFEALAMNRPILVSSVAALADIANDCGSGMIFEKGDAGSLAEKMQLFIQRRRDGECLASARGREWVLAERSWNVVAEGLKGLYQELH